MCGYLRIAAEGLALHCRLLLPAVTCHKGLATSPAVHEGINNRPLRVRVVSFDRDYQAKTRLDHDGSRSFRRSRLAEAPTVRRQSDPARSFFSKGSQRPVQRQNARGRKQAKASLSSTLKVVKFWIKFVPCELEASIVTPERRKIMQPCAKFPISAWPCV